MKVTLKKVGAALLAFAMIFTSAVAAGPDIKAYAEAISGSNSDYATGERGNIEQPQTSLILQYGPDAMMVEAGQSYNVTQRFVLKQGIGMYLDPTFLGSSTNNMVKFSNIEVKPYGNPYVSNGINFRSDRAVEINYTITISSIAKVGKIEYGITAYNSRPSAYDEDKKPVYANTGAFNVSLDVVTACSDPLFVLQSDPRIKAEAGKTVEIPIRMKNMGQLDAYDIYVSLGGNSNLIATETPLKQKMPSTAAGGEIETTYKFLVDSKAVTGTITLPINVFCRDYSGATYSDDSYYVILDIKGKDGASGESGDQKPSRFGVTNVKQSPEKPKAGENITVTFDLENTGDMDFNEIRAYLGSVSSMGFEPIDSNPYIELGDIKGRNKKQVSLTYKCGSSISEGTNPMSINFVAESNSGQSIEGNTTIYILNVAGHDGGNTVSKPKLMVADFGTDLEEILASDRFEFRFNVKNTNDESVARNIKVKVTSSSFSVTAGSNTFFVNEILPGEETEIRINLKAASTLQTGAYPINVEMEYEFDAPVKAGESGNSVTASDEILLQVNELLRAQCENVNVGEYLTPAVNSPCSLTFEFYNMGRSTLNNVYVTVEGDFALATGDSHYIGNVMPGDPQFVECTVMPLAAGDAECRLVIHMEDSNGEQQTRDYSSTVYVVDGGNGGNGGEFDPGFIMPDFPMNPDMPGEDVEPEKKSLDWRIIGGCIAGAAVIIGVVVIVIVKKKKKKANDDEFDD